MLLIYLPSLQVNIHSLNKITYYYKYLFYIPSLIDIPFMNGTYIHGSNAFYRLSRDGITIDEGDTPFSFSFIVSTNLKSKISCYLSG